MMIKGISHLTFLVRDLERSARIFQYVLDGEEIYNSGDRFFSVSREKFFLIGGLWICLMEGDSVNEKSYNHVAFSIPDEEYDSYEERVRALGLEIRPTRPRVVEEGRSLYFYDYDHHLFELHTGNLMTRLARYQNP